MLDDVAVDVTRREAPDRGHRGRIGRHIATICDDGGEVAARADRDDGDARDPDVAQDRDEDGRFEAM